MEDLHQPIINQMKMENQDEIRIHARSKHVGGGRFLRKETKKEVGSEGACTKLGGWRNIVNGERRTIPQLVSTLSRQNQCDLNLLHPLQHPLDRSTSPRACLAGWLAGWLAASLLPFELPLHVEFHYRKQSAAPHYGVCAKFTDHGYKFLLLSSLCSSSSSSSCTYTHLFFRGSSRFFALSLDDDFFFFIPAMRIAKFVHNNFVLPIDRKDRIESNSSKKIRRNACIYIIRTILRSILSNRIERPTVFQKERDTIANALIGKIDEPWIPPRMK